jgi:hypothetical protein
VTASEKGALKKAKPAISLFALTSMHNRKVDMGDGNAAVSIMEDMRGNLGAFAIAEVGKDFGHGPLSAALWIFETGLPVFTCCEPGIAPATRSPFIGDFEMTDQIRLRRP